MTFAGFSNAFDLLKTPEKHNSSNNNTSNENSQTSDSCSSNISVNSTELKNETNNHYKSQVKPYRKKHPNIKKSKNINDIIQTLNRNKNPHPSYTHRYRKTHHQQKKFKYLNLARFHKNAHLTQLKIAKILKIPQMPICFVLHSKNVSKEKCTKNNYR